MIIITSMLIITTTTPHSTLEEIVLWEIDEDVGANNITITCFVIKLFDVMWRVEWMYGSQYPNSSK